MANTKISALTDIASTPASGDKIPIVDVSDTTMGASGTTKYVNASRFLKTSVAGALEGTLNFNSNSATNISNATMGTATITVALTDGNGWQNPTFNTGWTNHGAPWQNVQYKKVGDFVFLRGLTKRTSGSETTILTLPSGYRPPSSETFTVMTNGNADGRIDIYNTGVVSFQAGSASLVQLSTIFFSVL